MQKSNKSLSRLIGCLAVAGCGLLSLAVPLSAAERPAAATPPAESAPAATSNLPVQVQMAVDAPGAYPSITFMYDRNLDYSILNNLESLYDQFTDRVWIELHGGTGLYWDPGNPPLDAYFVFAAKFSLMNPKLVRPQAVLNQAQVVRNLASLRATPLAEQAKVEAARVEELVRQYQKGFWWRRLSLGLSLPLMYPSNGAPEVAYDWAAVFAGYDLGDSLTLSLGFIPYHRAVALSLTLDLSTPVYGSGQAVINSLKDLFRMGRVNF